MILTLQILRLHFLQLNSSLLDLHKIQLYSFPSHNLKKHFYKNNTAIYKLWILVKIGLLDLILLK